MLMRLLNKCLVPMGYEVRHQSVRSWAEKLEALRFNSGLNDSAWLLYALVRSMKPEVCVEIGSAQGRSACFMGAALRANGRGKLYAIDPHMPTNWNDAPAVVSLPTMQANLKSADVENYVEIVRETSDKALDAWSRKIDLIFIDGDHSYDGVRSDWEKSLPHLHSRSIVVFHDTGWIVDERIKAQLHPDMGVPQLVEELRAQGYPVITSFQDCGVSLVQPVVGGAKLA